MRDEIDRSVDVLIYRIFSLLVFFFDKEGKLML